MLALWLHADLLRSALRVSQFHNYKGQHLASLILFKGPFVSIEEAVAKVNGGKSQESTKISCWSCEKKKSVTLETSLL